MVFLLEPAVREKINILFAITGDSGSGKTFSSLSLARGMSGDDGIIVVIDNDSGRSSHYAPIKNTKADASKGTFEFSRINFPPPFTPELFIEAIKEALTCNPSTIIIDNFSQEWNGDGGILEIVDENAATDTKGLSVWKKPRARHNKLMSFILQSKCNFIFCLDSKDKKTYATNDRGKTEVVSAGYLPVCEGRFLNQMTAYITLHPSNPGKINYNFPKKIPGPILNIFKNNDIVTIQQGRQLKEWAETGMLIEKSKLKIGYERLEKALSEITSYEQLQKIIVHPATINLRKELAEKEPMWAGIIDTLIERALREFDNEEAQVNA